jgi:hypothetical protein
MSTHHEGGGRADRPLAAVMVWSRRSSRSPEARRRWAELTASLRRPSARFLTVEKRSLRALREEEPHLARRIAQATCRSTNFVLLLPFGRSATFLTREQWTGPGLLAAALDAASQRST